MTHSTQQPAPPAAAAPEGAQRGADWHDVALGPSAAASSAAGSEGSSEPQEKPAKATAKEFMQANAGLREWTATQFLLLLLLTIVVQLSWGLYGVCTRYLQTRPPDPIPTFQLMVCLNLLAWPGMILGCTVPKWWWKRRKARRAAAKAAAAADGSDSGDGKAAEEEAAAGVTSDEAPAGPPAAKPPLKQRFRAWLRSGGVAYGIASLAVFQALTQVYASKLANAYVSQMVFMSAPILAALANRLVLKQPTPAGLWPTIALTIAGSVLVVVGQLQQNAADPSATTPSTGKLILGCVLALTSTLLLTAYLVLIQVTRHLCSGEAVLWAKRNLGLLLFIPLSFAVEGVSRWRWVTSLDAAGWGVLVFTGVYIYTLMNILLQFVTRAMGAALIAVFLSLRLVSSVVGSIVLLHEVPTEIITWVGLGIVTVITAVFVGAQQHHKQRAAKRAARAAAEAAALDALEAGSGPGRKGCGSGEGEGDVPVGAQHAGLPTAVASFMSHTASFLRPRPRSFLGHGAAAGQRPGLQRASAPPQVPFWDAVGCMSDNGYTPPDDVDEEEEGEGAEEAAAPPGAGPGTPASPYS